ncbi:MAG: phosphoribosylanthranilate isomerase [Pseudomonadota bacterium]
MKICGITRPEDARLACDLGADAIGVILVPRSKRCVDLDAARRVRDAVDGLAALVMLVADAEAETIERAVDAVDPDLIQFHGSESPEACARHGRPWLKALSHSVFEAEAGRYAGARGLVVDSHPPGALGGTGQTFDWTGFPGNIGGSLLLAGGLTPDNVGRAIEAARPYGVDVASGVESAPGIKDAALLERFFREVRRVDCSDKA